MISIPGKDKKWIQTNVSDILGNLWATQGCDFLSNVGKVRAGDNVLLNTSSSDDDGITTAIGFRAFAATGLNGGAQSIFAICGGANSKSGVFYSNGSGVPSTGFTRDLTAGSPITTSSDYSDVEVFNGYLYVTAAAATNVYKLSSAGSWTNFAAGATDSVSPHMLCVYADRMYMTRVGNQVISWSTADAVASSGANTVALPSPASSNYITFLRASSNRIWIGTVNRDGGKGYVYEWDGAAQQVQKSYRLDSSGALACVIKDDVPYIMNTNGVIQVWNGGTFKDLDDARVGLDARFNRVNGDLLYNPLSATNDRFIHPNGMTLVNGYINLFVKTDDYTSSALTREPIPAGVWEYLPEVGLYNKGSVSYSISSTTTPTDYGQIKIKRAGAMAEMNLPSTTSGRNGEYLIGCQYYTDASTTKYGVFYNDSVFSQLRSGYIITAKVNTDNVTENFQKLFLKYKKLTASTCKIIGKYRTAEIDPTEAAITYTGITATTTTFTTATSLANYAVGDEVEILQGVGGGLCAHITAISLNAGTYTVTVDEPFYGVTTQTAVARFQKWIKLFSTTDTNATIQEKSFGVKSTYIQFKIFFIFRDKEEIVQLLIANAANQPAI